MKLKWTGKGSTLVRPYPNDPKVEVAPGGTVDVSPEQADLYTKYSSEFEVVTADVKPKQVQKAYKKPLNK